MKLELSKDQVQSLINLINASNFNGGSIEKVYELKVILKEALNDKHNDSNAKSK